jgi:hypothetical protein
VAIFYADENILFALNDALRFHGHAVFTTRDERRLGATDGSQLLYAADRGWIVLTHNRSDFTMMHGIYGRTLGVSIPNTRASSFLNKLIPRVMRKSPC